MQPRSAKEDHLNKRRRRKLLLRKAVAERLGVTPRVVSSLVSRGIIPAPTYLDAYRPAWVEDEIDALIEERIASRDTGI